MLGMEPVTRGWTQVSVTTPNGETGGYLIPPGTEQGVVRGLIQRHRDASPNDVVEVVLGESEMFDA